MSKFDAIRGWREFWALWMLPLCVGWCWEQPSKISLLNSINLWLGVICGQMMQRNFLTYAKTVSTTALFLIERLTVSREGLGVVCSSRGQLCRSGREGSRAMCVKAGTFPKVEKASHSAVSAVHKTALHSICEVAQTVENLPAMWETWVWSLGRKDPREKEMATLSSILAWRIPCTEESGRLQSVESQRVGHNWATNTHTCGLLKMFWGILMNQS